MKIGKNIIGLQTGGVVNIVLIEEENYPVFV
jgi:hypothetical protein